MKNKILPAVLLGGLILLASTGFQDVPKGREPVTKEELGELLFHEKKFSKNNNISCGSCHKAAFAFADTVAFSNGADGLPGKRNTPSVMNMASRPYFFYDGRAASLEDQIRFPVEDHLEMNQSFSEACKKIMEDPFYIGLFRKIYGTPPDSTAIKDAIAAFERTLETSDTPFDRWMKGDSKAISASAIRGRSLFMDDNKTKCFVCHFSPDFTGDEFRNIGLYDGVRLLDKGRFDVTGDSADLGRFKTPGLRNVAITAPYMHNGMFKTLREVLEYYNDPSTITTAPINMDTLLQKPLGLSEEELMDLENFLHALTDKRFSKSTRN